MSSSVRLFLLCITLFQIAALEPVDLGANCSPKKCGNLIISDPFGFVPAQATDTKCGRLGFEVHCNNSIPYLGYYRRKYRFRILDIFYDNSSLLVVDIHKFGDFSASDSKGCHVLTANTSPKVGLPFLISPVNLNLIFYYCTNIPKADRGLVKTKCSSSLLVRVGIGGHYNDSSNYTQYSVEGCSTTLVPVLRTYGKPNASNYEQLISDGFFLTWQLPSGAIDDNTTASCSPARCGNLSITYPFSLSGVQPLYCGYPALELACDAAGRAYLSRTSRQHLYRVDDISYNNNSMVLAVEATFAGDTTCTVPDFNVSSGLSLFQLNISDTNKNLVFVYNCVVPPSVRLPRPCANHTMGAYVSDGEGSSRVPANCSSVSVPVRGFHAGMEPARDLYEGLIGDGFLLEWTAAGDCDACKRNGGECRFVQLSFQCFCPDDALICSTTLRGVDSTARTILIVLTVAGGIVATVCIPCLIWYGKDKKPHVSFLDKTSDNVENKIEELIMLHGSLTPKRYKYLEVTSSLGNKLGEGGYGTVFRGTLHDGRVVAVKLLHNSKGNGDEFVNEVMSIGKTSHVNIVSLFGFCFEGSKRALIYDYMPNGSLDKFIYSENPKGTLGWEVLYKIAIGVARGLQYLHHSCNTRIVHFDIKPQNILLDRDFCPKIADFGLAKLCRAKESKLSVPGARGTIGFIAPEVLYRTFGVVSTKSDVYGYGMMLLEMVGGRKNVKSMVERSSEKYFPDWIYDHFAQDDGLQACGITSEFEEMAKKMTLIGLWCIQILPMHRPTITHVLDMFERRLDELEMPPKQNFCQLFEDSAQNLSAESACAEVPSEVFQVENIPVI